MGYTIWGLRTHWTLEILFLFSYLDNILSDFRCWLVEGCSGGVGH